MKVHHIVGRLTAKYHAQNLAREERSTDGGESWVEKPLPQGVHHIYALACG
jgi:hypothetical protein